MKCQNLFSGENKKNISACRMQKILPRLLSFKYKCKLNVIGERLNESD